MHRTRKHQSLIVAALIGAVCSSSPARCQDAANQNAPAREHRTRNVAIVVHEGVELLDFAGPGEVFAAAARRGSPPGGTPWFNVFTVAPKAGAILSQGFVSVEPRYTIDDSPAPDILVIPGGATGALLNDSKFMNWVRDNASRREISMSVCTGALVYARAGMLDGQSATTHWGSLDALRREAPTASVIENTRFIDNGAVITTAGVSAGIDGALHVIARLLGRDVADQTARYMEYEWTPDERAAAKYSKLNPQLDARGQEFQQADALRRAEDWPTAIKAYESLTAKYPDDAEAWYQLGYCVHAAGDLDRAIELHRKAATFNEGRQRPLYNLACAYALKGDADKAFAALNEAIAAGWNNPGFLAHDADWAAFRADPRFKTAIERMNAGRPQR